jgi:glycine betaine/choline ABC-type transport system substrate-binding protein
MRLNRILPLLCLALVSIFLVSACGDDSEKPASGGASTPAADGGKADKLIKSNPDNAKTTLTIGSKNFAEEFILGEIYAQALEAAGYKVKKQLNLGSEQIAFKAVKSGQVDAYPEYTGTSLVNFFKVKTDDVPDDAKGAYEEAKTRFAKVKLVAFAPTPFTDSNGFAMTKARAEELGITKLSDLADKAKDLTLYGPPECRQREDCALGLEKVYGLKFKKLTTVDLELRHEVLEKGQADVSLVFTTDGEIKAKNEQLLEDDKHLFPPYNASLIARQEAVDSAGPDFQKTAETVQEGLTTEVMQELNSRVTLDKEKPAEVAATYLRETGYIK